MPSGDSPTITMRPRRGWAELNLKEIWDYRELLYFLVWRDVKVRYHQALLGVAWAIIQPLATMAVFSLFFGALAKVPSDNLPYPLFAYVALVPWIFFSGSITAASASLVGNSNLLTKVYFPRMLIPGAAVAGGLLDFFVAFLLVIPLLAWYQIPVTANLLMLPVLVLLSTTLALGVGLWLSALNVRYRDIRHAVPFLVQILMFATPIIYPASLMPEKYRILLAFNPMASIVEGYRVALLGGASRSGFDWPGLALAFLISGGVLVFAAFYFRRLEARFADIV